MVKVLKMFETPDKDYMESFYSVAGNSILHFRTQYVDNPQEIYELCTNKDQVRKLRDFLNTMLKLEFVDLSKKPKIREKWQVM